MIAMRPRELLAALVAEHVDFVLVGGLAAAIHGTTRITRDIDIAYATQAENLDRLCNALNRFEPRRMLLGKPEGKSFSLTVALLKKERVVQLATTIGEVDLLDRIRGFASYGYLRANAEVQDIGVLVPVLSVGGLLRAKRAMKRPKDLQDILELEALEEARELTGEPNASAAIRLRIPED
ncbi:MAG: hypothetical protein PXZ07_08090 [Candidatus Eremiobacteraeota bacterium]|nr:hypothetical protein [Candidatus Eremiobacteraeota bacterium]